MGNINNHVDMTIDGFASVGFLLDGWKYCVNPIKDLNLLNEVDQLVCLDAVRDMKCEKGLYHISKELADALNMKKGQRGQLVWVPILDAEGKEIK